MVRNSELAQPLLFRTNLVRSFPEPLELIWLHASVVWHSVCGPLPRRSWRATASPEVATRILAETTCEFGVIKGCERCNFAVGDAPGSTDGSTAEGQAADHV
eukprot:jgi/Ulvmu1/10155/UM006_0109.1